MKLPFSTYDVFTRERFCGNQLAIVDGGAELNAATMQNIAREFNFSETVFVLPAQSPVATARIRIFTPMRELPFAGHPTIGAAVHLAEGRRRTPNGEDEQLILVEQLIGPVRVGVRLRPGEPGFAEFGVPKLPEAAGIATANELLAAALGLAPSEIGFENHRPTRFSAGVAYTFVPVVDLEAIGRASLVSAHWQAAFGDGGGAYLYCRQTLHLSVQFHARMFIPDVGEDPATGSAAAAFAAVIHRFDQPVSGDHLYRIEQGHEMGRPSEIGLEVGMVGHQLRAVRVGGHAVQVAAGVINL